MLCHCVAVEDGMGDQQPPGYHFMPHGHQVYEQGPFQSLESPGGLVGSGHAKCEG